jgi:hypothetical protein
MNTIRRIIVVLAFAVCLAFSIIAGAAYLLLACPVIGARHGWRYADGIIRKEIGS